MTGDVWVDAVLGGPAGTAVVSPGGTGATVAAGSLVTGVTTTAAGELRVADPASLPLEPPAELFYRHRPNLWTSARETFRRREVIFTLAERDIRAGYKQAVLGVGWAVISPVLSLVMFTLLLSHVKSFQTPGVPYAVKTYIGLWAYGLFGGAIGGASSALISNKAMMAKTHFPRECFSLAQVLESAFTSAVALVPMVIVFGVYRYPPRLESLWFPVFLIVEIPFMMGAVLIVSSVVVQARDLLQVMPMLTQFFMLATPVIWPMSRFIHGSMRPVYAVLNPMGPVIDGIQRSMLLGHGPDWGLLGLALAGSFAYLLGGFALFKRLEVNFADLA